MTPTCPNPRCNGHLMIYIGNILNNGVVTAEQWLCLSCGEEAANSDDADTEPIIVIIPADYDAWDQSSDEMVSLSNHDEPDAEAQP